MRTGSFWRGLLVLSLTACVSGGGNSPGTARVLVYNIHAGKDTERRDNLERVAEIVRDSRADIVLLQEVDNRTARSGAIDQLARLRDLTGFHGHFGKTINYDGGEYGIALLSRWPIEAAKLTRLVIAPADSPSGAAYEERGALIARIRTPSGWIRVVNTHLDATRSDSNRVRQARALVSIANAQRDSGLTLLGGDLNSPPGGAALMLLHEAGWRDLFGGCGTGQPFSFPADAPARRIDYLMGSEDAVCRSASVIDTRVSDHRPVLFEIDIRRGK